LFPLFELFIDVSLHPLNVSNFDVKSNHSLIKRGDLARFSYQKRVS
jgi:hypothetical protein